MIILAKHMFEKRGFKFHFYLNESDFGDKTFFDTQWFLTNEPEKKLTIKCSSQSLLFYPYAKGYSFVNSLNPTLPDLIERLAISGDEEPDTTARKQLRRKFLRDSNSFNVTLQMHILTTDSIILMDESILSFNYHPNDKMGALTERSIVELLEVNNFCFDEHIELASEALTKLNSEIISSRQTN